MSVLPKCIIVTGRPGSGKTTLARRLAEAAYLPLISRDAIKEGFVHTHGVRHDQLPGDPQARVFEAFFGLAVAQLREQVTTVLEAAFQHKVWAGQLPKLQAVAEVRVIVCDVPADVAARRHLQRGLDDPRREYFHGDARVAEYRATGKMGPPAPYETPELGVPTLHVDTTDDYAPSLDDILEFATN
ncbi:MAG: AAA family ATPase [Planctomycetota bacterium]